MKIEYSKIVLDKFAYGANIVFGDKDLCVGITFWKTTHIFYFKCE